MTHDPNSGQSDTYPPPPQKKSLKKYDTKLNTDVHNYTDVKRRGGGGGSYLQKDCCLTIRISILCLPLEENNVWPLKGNIFW